MNDPKHLSIETHGEILIVRIVTDSLFDPLVVFDFDRELQEAVQTHQPKQVLVDFEHVQRTATGVINSLLLAKKSLIAIGGDIAFFNVSENIRHTYRVLRLEGTMFLIFDDEREALEHYSQ